MYMQQSSKSEQISRYGSIIYDYDQTIKSKNGLLKAYTDALGRGCGYELYDGKKVVYFCIINNIRHYFLTGAITWLNKPHPLYKKRLQLKTWYKDFYIDNCRRNNVVIHLMGVYHYEGLNIFVEFNLEDYISNKINSSAAHVYSNDLYQALINKAFHKTDKKGNHITTIQSEHLKKYLSDGLCDNSLFALFKKFNNFFTFGEWITAREAITEMKENEWYQWKGTEWAGWFLEYKMNNFIDKENCHNEMNYIGEKRNSSLLDFDLYFEKQLFFGDLKASDIERAEAPANDQENVLNALTTCGRLWYIIYEHDTIRDKDCNSEMAIFRTELTRPLYKTGDKISYKSRMKHSVKFNKMRIFELNRINMHTTLKTFYQGHQPSGEPRNPKFFINKKNIDNFVVFTYNFET